MLRHKITEEQLIENHAQRLFTYRKALTLSTEFVSTDPLRRDALLQSRDRPSSLSLTGHPSLLPNAAELLKMYDEELKVTPVTFEEHIERMHVAFSAGLIYLETVVYTQYTNYNRAYTFYLGVLTRSGQLETKDLIQRGVYTGPVEAAAPVTAPLAPPPPPPPRRPDQELLTLSEINALLRDSSALLDAIFVAENDSGPWRVSDVVKKKGAVEYGIQLDEIPNAPYHVLEQELVDFLTISYRIQ